MNTWRGGAIHGDVMSLQRHHDFTIVVADHLVAYDEEGVPGALPALVWILILGISMLGKSAVSKII